MTDSKILLEAAAKRRQAIMELLIEAKAVTCSPTELSPVYAGPNKTGYYLPSGYHVEVDYGKLAATIYSAGYTVDTGMSPKQYAEIQAALDKHLESKLKHAPMKRREREIYHMAIMAAKSVLSGFNPLAKWRND